jgi:pimeloyl-ACP methyl ester carboxylesterase
MVRPGTAHRIRARNCRFWCVLHRERCESLHQQSAQAMRSPVGVVALRGIFTAVLAFCFTLGSSPAQSRTAPLSSAADAGQRHLALSPAIRNAQPLAAASPCTPIVIGFVGGFVSSRDSIHPEVQFGSELRHTHPGIKVRVFSNHEGRRAYRTVLSLLDADGDGSLSTDERSCARIVLYGHSWGAAQAMTLAHELDRQRIPVILAAMIDSIGKGVRADAVVPPNVTDAINFYQTGGLFHGVRRFRAADSAHTRILANIRMRYHPGTIDCSRYPWYARRFMGPHIQIENDQRVWNRIRVLVDAELAPNRELRVSQLPPWPAYPESTPAGDPQRR